jgi:hypothetical protein
MQPSAWLALSVRLGHLDRARDAVQVGHAASYEPGEDRKPGEPNGEPTASDSGRRQPTADQNICRSEAHRPTLTDANLRIWARNE